MQEPVVKRFLEYKPPQSPEETKHTRTPSFSAGQRPLSSQHHHHQQQNVHSPSFSLHHYRFPSQTFQRPGGMACSRSPAASPTSSHASRSSAGTPTEHSTHHQGRQPHRQPQPPSLPRPRPHSGPKAKFTLDDDALLTELKEKHEMTWKQIAEFFPGRSSGTLQVRYCTKLKAKGAAWTDEMVARLRHALHEYENERWRVVSSKVGHGFSAGACKQKAEELELAA